MRWWTKEYSVGRNVQINGKVAPGSLADIPEKSPGFDPMSSTG